MIYALQMVKDFLNKYTPDKPLYVYTFNLTKAHNKKATFKNVTYSLTDAIEKAQLMTMDECNFWSSNLAKVGIIVKPILYNGTRKIKYIKPKPITLPYDYALEYLKKELQC